MFMKEWKEREIASKLNGGFVESIDSIERETEKAYLLNITWAYTSDLTRAIQEWVPKSATMTDDEYDAELEREVERLDAGREKYNNLIAFAKNNNVKGVRVGLRKDTILNKITEAGLLYEY